MIIRPESTFEEVDTAIQTFSKTVHPLYVANSWTWSRCNNEVPSVDDIYGFTQQLYRVLRETAIKDNFETFQSSCSGRIVVQNNPFLGHIEFLVQPM